MCKSLDKETEENLNFVLSQMKPQNVSAQSELLSFIHLKVRLFSRQNLDVNQASYAPNLIQN